MRRVGNLKGNKIFFIECTQEKGIKLNDRININKSLKANNKFLYFKYRCMYILVYILFLIP